MSRSLLRTKIHHPPPRSQLIPRPQLIERLNDGLCYRPLTLVSASAGFGKTTTLSTWIQQSERHIAWLALDEGDNDPTRFWTYFIATLQTLDAKVGGHARAMLLSQEQPRPHVEAFLNLLLNDMAALPQTAGSTDAAGSLGGLALVLDDYHVINNPAIHEAVTFLVEHLPPQMHVCIATRSDPPLPLARWRARGQLAEVRTDDLRLSSEEAAAYLSQVMGLSLSPDEVLALHGRTEGWIVGLQLAALALRGRTDPAEFISAFTGSHHYIIDYLTQEILQRQPESIQSFLLDTAMLDRMSGALCDAVTGRADGQTVLESLEQANVFTVMLDDERQWYRYHYLFAEMLRSRLRRLHPARLPDLHQRASEWYEQNGLADEAVRHALAANDVERAARLIEQNAGTVFWMRGEIGTFLEWLEALPAAWVRLHPRLGLLDAWALLLSGQLASVETRLADVERSLRDSADVSPLDASVIRRAQGQIAAIRSRLARLHNDLPRAIELAQVALESLPPDDQALRSVITLNLGIAHWQSGDLSAATHILMQASSMDGSSGIALVALGILGDLAAEQGYLHQAAETYQQAIDRAAADGHEPSPMASWAWVGLGNVQRAWNDLDTAEHYTRQGLELAKQWGNADGLAWAWLHLAQLKAAQEDAGAAQAALVEAEQTVRRYQVAPWTAAQVAGYTGQMRIRQGNLAEAARWVRERGLNLDDEFSYGRELEYLALARRLHTEGPWEAAESFLERLLRSAENRDLTGRVIDILVLQALARSPAEHPAQAELALQLAVSLAEAEGYVRVFVDEGKPMRSLLADYRRRIEASSDDSARRALPFVDRLIGAFPVLSENPKVGFSTEPLSARELEILPLLAEGLSNREIAQRLFLSVGTVKQHLKHIYGKFAVNNRTQAVARARELNLL